MRKLRKLNCNLISSPDVPSQGQFVDIPKVLWNPVLKGFLDGSYAIVKMKPGIIASFKDFISCYV